MRPRKESKISQSTKGVYHNSILVLNKSLLAFLLFTCSYDVVGRVRNLSSSTDQKNAGRANHQQGQHPSAFKSSNAISSANRVDKAYAAQQGVRENKQDKHPADRQHRETGSVPNKRPATNHNVGHNGVKHPRTEGEGRSTCLKLDYTCIQLY